MTFYAHYDKQTGAILSIGGHHIPDVFPDAEVAELADEVALPFMLHELDMSEWAVGYITGSTVPVVTQQFMEIIPHDKGDMIELPRNNFNAMGIRVAVLMSEDKIEFTIPKAYTGSVPGHITEPVIDFVLTKRNDPTFVVATIEVDIAMLMATGIVVHDVALELKDYSMFTNKHFHHYQFEVFQSPKGVVRNKSNSRINNLVVYRSGNLDSGVKASYDEIHNQLTLEIVGKTRLSWPNTDRCFLFLTKLNDPTVIHHAVPFNVDTFWENKRIVLELPKELNQAFGIASFPLATDLVFNRQSDGNPTTTNN